MAETVEFSDSFDVPIDTITVISWSYCSLEVSSSILFELIISGALSEESSIFIRKWFGEEAPVSEKKCKTLCFHWSLLIRFDLSKLFRISVSTKTNIIQQMHSKCVKPKKLGEGKPCKNFTDEKLVISQPDKKLNVILTNPTLILTESSAKPTPFNKISATGLREITGFLIQIWVNLNFFSTWIKKFRLTV